MSIHAKLTYKKEIKVTIKISHDIDSMHGCKLVSLTYRTNAMKQAFAKMSTDMSVSTLFMVTVAIIKITLL